MTFAIRNRQIVVTFENPLASRLFPSPDTGLFSADYAEARQRWLTALSSIDASLRSFPCAGSGPNGEVLATDAVWIGAHDAQSVVVLLAGTHGVEGFVGSAVQLDVLQALIGKRLAETTALLLVHSLTPWGFAWLRRCGGDGVDLNRNAVDFSAPLPINPHYDALRPELFDTDATRRRQAFAEFERQFGRVAFEQAVSGGQYSDPAGPFYGGRAATHGRSVCEDLIERFSLRQRRLAIIDLHSGLGPYGYGEIICDHAPDSAGAVTARRWYGNAVTLPLAGTSSSVPKLGLLDYLWHEAMGGDSCYVTLEFGSYSTEQLFAVLLTDHQLWAQSGNEAARAAHSLAMREHFCPADPAWRVAVLARARQVIDQALTGVAA